MSHPWSSLVVKKQGPFPRFGHTASVVDNNIFIYGGVLDNADLDMDESVSVLQTGTRGSARCV